LEIFLFFRIQIQHFEFHQFETGRNRYWAGPVSPVPAVSGPILGGSVNPARGPWQTGSPNESAHTLGEGRGEPTLAWPPLPPPPVVASWPVDGVFWYT
jgi:hypothetical protein